MEKPDFIKEGAKVIYEGTEWVVTDIGGPLDECQIEDEESIYWVYGHQLSPLEEDKPAATPKPLGKRERKALAKDVKLKYQDFLDALKLAEASGMELERPITDTSWYPVDEILLTYQPPTPPVETY